MKHLKRFNENNSSKTLEDIVLFCKNKIIEINSGRVNSDVEKVLDVYKDVIRESGIKVFSDEYLRTEKILSKWYIDSYIINDDGTVDVNDNIIINSNMSKLPIKFGKVTGSFDCSECGLETLEGSPYYVGSGFNCSGNKLKDLKESPGEIIGSFYCLNNKLESLEGMTLEIGGNFNCYGNPNLKELDSVSNIEGEIICDKHVDISKFSGECRKINVIGKDDEEDDLDGYLDDLNNLEF